jgi:signal peptidase I
MIKRRTSPPSPPLTERPRPGGASGASTERSLPRRIVGAILQLGLLLVLVLVLRPPSLGGTTGYTIVSGHSMEPTYHTGDIVVTRPEPDLAVGDVIVYEVPDGEPGAGHHVIHRIIGGDAVEGFITQGDNNPYADPWRPKPHDVIGTVVLLIPQGANVLVIATGPLGVGAVAALAFLWLLWPRTPEDESPDDTASTADPEPADTGPPDPLVVAR